MGYVGNQTTNAYTSLDKQTITGDGGASYTLDHAVANENEIEVFVNNVRQEPSVAYTVSGTALTMTGNVEASDDFYVVFQGKAIQTVVPPDLTVDTAKIKDDAVTSTKIADDAVKIAHINEDFYKTGTWTPVLEGASATKTWTYNAQSGFYTKVGNQVTAWFVLQLSNDGSGTDGNALISGLPFTSANNSLVGFYGFFWKQLIETGDVALMGKIPTNASYISLLDGSSSYPDISYINTSTLTNDHRIRGTITYMV